MIAKIMRRGSGSDMSLIEAIPHSLAPEREKCKKYIYMCRIVVGGGRQLCLSLAEDRLVVMHDKQLAELPRNTRSLTKGIKFQ